MVYDVKNGEQKKKITKQMTKRGKFIHNYMKRILTDIDIYYFGLYKERKKGEINIIISNQALILTKLVFNFK